MFFIFHPFEVVYPIVEPITVNMVNNFTFFIEPFGLFKPADTPSPSVSSLFAKYNGEVVEAVSASLKQIYSYYQNQVEAKPEPPKPVHEKTSRAR